MFELALRHENMHRDFTPCYYCGATTFTQHLSLCSRASVRAVVAGLVRARPKWSQVSDLRDRREFLKDALKSAATLAVAGAIPVLVSQDPYDDFLRRVGEHVKRIVRREGRGFSRIQIEAPHYLHVHIDVANERTTVEETPEGFRFVKLWLEGDPSPHTWNEPSNCA
jgi:hypothetical protein